MLEKHPFSRLTGAFFRQAWADNQPYPPLSFPVDYGDDRPSVNYIWINEFKDELSDKGPMCSIGLQNVRLAIENANRYPEADFALWVDKSLLNDLTSFWLPSYIYQQSLHGNLAIRDLREIPDYARDGFFDPPDENCPVYSRTCAGSVYLRADVSRILVLDYCLNHPSVPSRILYSDIDCEDIKLHRAVQVMDRHGIVINDTGEILSHGYIGISSRHPKVCEHFPFFKETTRLAAYNCELGDHPFSLFLNRIDKPYSIFRKKIGLPKILPRVTYRVPEDEFMRELGIN